MNKDNYEKCIEKVLEVGNKKMGLNVKSVDIEYCYRIGNTNTGKCQPLMVNFFNRYHRRLVISNKKLLKGTKVVVREDLTSMQLALLKFAFAKVNKKGIIRTHYGNIFLKLDDEETIRKVTTEQHIHEIVYMFAFFQFFDLS